VTEPRQPQPFNEAAALAELERLADRIQATRRQREQAVAEFDAFVRTFRPPVPEPVKAAGSTQTTVVSPSSSAAKPTSPPPSSQLAPPILDPAVVAILDTPTRVNGSVSRTIEAVHHRPPGVLEELIRDRRLVYGAIAAVVLGLVLVGFFLLRSWRSQPAASSESPAPAVPTATAPAQASAPAPSPTAGAVPRALNIELVTLRPVWMRVTIDGDRVLGREVPAKQRLSFSADRSIVIRAGDAGGVRLTVNGRDEGPLGRNGGTVTRTLKAPPPTGR
jgi:cytoskeleton protein RodZ